MTLRSAGVVILLLSLHAAAQNLKLPNGLVTVKETPKRLGSGHDGWVFKISVRSAPNLCLDLVGGSNDNGTPLDVWECNGQEGQLWFFDDGSYQITAGSDSSKCLDAGDMQAGNQLFLWDCNGSDQQIWGYDWDAGTIYLVASGDASLCLDIAGGDTSGGTPVQIWDCDFEWNQAWDIMSGVTIRVSADYTKCLDLAGGDSSNGSPIQIWDCNGMDEQLWNFEGDSWEIRYAADTSKCIDAGDMQDGTQLFLWDCNGYDSQKFGYDSDLGSLYLAMSGDASNCVDISGGSLDDGTTVGVWDCNNCWNQQFQVTGPVSFVQSKQLTKPESKSSLRGSSGKESVALADCPPWPFGPSPPPSPPPTPSPAPTPGHDTCQDRGGCTCDCSWTGGGANCGPDDGSCCWGCCCNNPGPSPAPPPTPTPTPSPPPSPSPTGASGTASTTRYWDCSKPTCAWASKCPGSGHDKFASDWNQLFKGSDGRIYGTVASSGSFGMDDAGGGCMKCYDLVVKDGPAAGKEITVMATNYCPDQPTCPAAGQTNPKGQQYHFDIAIPGGGLGLQGKCSEEYGGGDWKVNSAADCGKLPAGIQGGCNLWYDDLNGMDNPLVDWTEVTCPSELADRC